MRVLIEGPPGCGKSTIAYLLAKMMKSNVCINYTPTSTLTTTLDTVYQHVTPAVNNPLIILFDEYNELVNTVYNSELKQVDMVGYTRKAYDQSSFNTRIDTVDMFYSNIIFIMTYNPEIEPMIPSKAIRSGRVNMRIYMHENISSLIPSVQPTVIDLKRECSEIEEQIDV